MEKKNIFKMQAEVCKTIANPKRLEIISILKKGEKTAGEIAKELDVPKSNVSQHLTILKSHNIVKSRREGTNIFYEIANKKIIDACTLMREVMIESLEEQQAMIKSLKKIK